MTKKKIDNGTWLPAIGEKYYYLLPSDEVKDAVWDNWGIDRTRREFYNVFKTKDEALTRQAKKKAWTSPNMAAYAHRNRFISLDQYNEALIWLSKHPTEYKSADYNGSNESYRYTWSLYKRGLEQFKKENDL